MLAAKDVSVPVLFSSFTALYYLTSSSLSFINTYMYEAPKTYPLYI